MLLLLMLQVRGLACALPDGRPLVEGLDLDLSPGQNLLVAGADGMGRGHLLKVLAGTERPRAGKVAVAGIPVWPGEGALGLAGRVRMGFAFPTGGLLSNLSLADNVALPLRFLGLSRGEVARRTGEALGRLGLEPVANLRPHAVSAAARKHANLARVLALGPELILLDAPLEGLDATDRSLALGLISGWALDSGCTLVLAMEGADLPPGPDFQTLDLRARHSPSEPS
ncbi:ATP-binding cassette domain-containing protein [Geothrix alkalitolerans]|uniref:ATP-binding cassette domain-containing protein n=1 Tax=Geothrix alkalitolerans TaxID=2922724 RepID=UPI001FAF24A0|nr:ATP-binding cassette domain-containing protein [Geothrix alkalitolerans]